MYAEFNTHTGEVRIHTEGSLLKRLSHVYRKGIKVLPDLPVEAMHAVFRHATERDIKRGKKAMQTGAWGLG